MRHMPQWLKLRHFPDWEYVDQCNDKDLTLDCTASRYQVETGSAYIFKARGWIPGWYMIELNIEHDLPFTQARLLIDKGNGFDISQSLSLNLQQDKLTKRLIYIPARTRAICLKLPDKEADFTLKSCGFVWLTPRFAYSRLLQRLVARHPQYQDMGLESVKSALKADADRQGVHWKEWLAYCYERSFSHSPTEEGYGFWLDELDAANNNVISGQDPEQEEMAYLPVVSIALVVCTGTDPEWLNSTIASVLAQRYRFLQLFVIRAGDWTDAINTTLAKLSDQDSRIRLVNAENFGINSVSGTSIFTVLTGEYTALLEPGDELAPDALFRIVGTLNVQGEVQLLYSDEDAINANGHRTRPKFKPGWNPDLLFSHNYISRLSVFRTERLRQIGWLREEYGEAQYHDLILRFTRNLPTESIVHIPQVLCHRRNDNGGGGNDTTCMQGAGLRMVAEAVHFRDPGAVIMRGLAPGSYHVQWSVPEPAPLVSLLVPTRDGVEILRPCVDAILARTSYKYFELIILDNGSRCPDTLQYIEEVVQRDVRVKVLRWNYPFNFSAINNFGVSHTNGSIIGLINNDVEPINADWLTEMVRQASREDIGCVGAKLYYPNDTLQHGGIILGLAGVAGHSHKHFKKQHSGYCDRLHLVQNLSAVTAACLLVRRSVFEEVGGLNEEELQVAFNDVDLCLKVREAGYRNLWTPHAELYHHESVSRGADDSKIKRERFLREAEYMRKTWGAQLDNDPAYNLNLTLHYEDFSLRTL